MTRTSFDLLDDLQTAKHELASVDPTIELVAQSLLDGGDPKQFHMLLSTSLRRIRAAGKILNGAISTLEQGKQNSSEVNP